MKNKMNDVNVVNEANVVNGELGIRNEELGIGNEELGIGNGEAQGAEPLLQDGTAQVADGAATATQGVRGAHLAGACDGTAQVADGAATATQGVRGAHLAGACDGTAHLAGASTVAEIWKTLSAVNVNAHTKTKTTGGVKLTYLSWSWAWGTLMKYYPDASWRILDGNTGFGYSECPLGLWVEVEVVIRGIAKRMRLPVFDSSNRQLRSSSYEMKKWNKFTSKYETNVVPPASYLDINTAQMRCLVKCIALFGLGLYIYAGEDVPTECVRESVNRVNAVAQGGNGELGIRNGGTQGAEPLLQDGTAQVADGAATATQGVRGAHLAGACDGTAQGGAHLTGACEVHPKARVAWNIFCSLPFMRNEKTDIKKLFWKVMMDRLFGLGYNITSLAAKDWDLVLRVIRDKGTKPEASWDEVIDAVKSN